MVGEAAVDEGVEQMMLAGQLRDEPLHRGAGGAVAAIPADAERAAGIAREQARDISGKDVVVGDAAGALAPRAGGGEAGEIDHIRAVEGAVAQHHLEAIVVARIVAARHMDAGVDAQRRFGEIQHRRGAEADAHDVDAACHEAGDQRGFEVGRGQAPVAPYGNTRAARGADAGGEAAADRGRVGGGEVAPHGAANVIFPQDRPRSASHAPR
ncbi:hypothetical protein WR25_26851 [Diploscapter pachys]|uniref:Uncharacterized protein n=1 Tax=Diploscapter pachys TaxID=2018661 RepID=A0A2A2M4J6_9BILA|nr:hypothetical protein WR25_26851 [Diploscapter pachys]